MNICESIKREKEKRGITNQSIADMSGVPIGTVNRLLSGFTENPTFSNVADICIAMGISIDEAIGIKEHKQETAANCEKCGFTELYERAIAKKERWIVALFCYAVMVSVWLFIK